MTDFVDPNMIRSAETGPAPASWSDKRTKGLARFAIAITTLNLLGHFWLGFEQSWATPFVAIMAAYGTELSLEWLSAREDGRGTRYAGHPLNLVRFLLSAHVTGLAVGMLLMPLEQLWVIAFAASLAVASKYLVRVSIGGGTRHVLNPSNFGITATLLVFPTVGIAPPYQFSEATSGAIDWLLPFVVICTGSLLNTKLTGRMPLILAWIAAFAAQAILRAFMGGAPALSTLMPMSGFAFVLFTFYMITDPATSPSQWRNQVLFGVSVAALYALFMELHIVFGQFYALTTVSALRGLWLAHGKRLSPLLRTDLASGRAAS